MQGKLIFHSVIVDYSNEPNEIVLQIVRVL